MRRWKRGCSLVSRHQKTSVQSMCLSVLFYGSDCWIPLRRHLKKLNSFHHRCVQIVLTNRGSGKSTFHLQQWGDVETITTKLVQRHLEWLGHFVRMLDHHFPKICLFGWLPQTCPHRGPRRRWRDLVKSDLK